MNRIIAVAFVVLTVAGCGWRKQHLTRGHGLSYDAAFDAQRERRDRAPAEAAIGLDAQEAAIISESYRSGLAPKEGGERTREPIILMSPATQERRYTPPPSVPKE
ncbi:conserved hypothetical protein [Anaeromyxobacter dehalogenans 2CP-1]|uniref:Lipoprotein n=1 Tax=Anaeromyxobacter dehalogenans (strain ATCC BAA-258 / DSM 21875 / 2CP-1) TaxID=455488 RepID=B8JFH1_ANAD2|nr:hypothetical protein [Anaeromyxobacter dehalogenans]ACL66348.1 conserved hypothetical protein [Anaeromyxobacter dehalogenans 2CP-1]